MSGMWEICFLLNGFLLGSLAPLYGKTFNYYLLFMVLFHAVTRKDSFVKDLQTGGKYVLVFGTYFIYILLQTLFTTRSCTWADKPYYGIFEDLLLDFNPDIRCFFKRMVNSPFAYTFSFLVLCRMFVVKYICHL